MSATSTALIQWDKQSQETVERMIVAGLSVPKALVLSAPKGFISDLRRDRRSFLMQNSSRISGEIAHKGFVICGQKAIRTDKHGNQRMAIEYIKPADAAVKAAESMGVPVEVLREAINAYKAKTVITLPKAA